MTLPHWMGVAGLPWHYSAVQLHLHWGSEVSMATGSEHTINGQSTAAELHIVHYNTEMYANMSEAKTQENGLAVLAILIEAGKEVNQGYGQKVEIPAFDIESLLPDNLSQYFRYNGSLTTPPCHQSVLWTIFNERVKISHSQLLKLQTALYSSKAEGPKPIALQDNYRTTQPLNRRTVLSSSIPGEIAAIVIGSLCGCTGLAVIICFIVKTVRAAFSPATSSARVAASPVWSAMPEPLAIMKVTPRSSATMDDTQEFPVVMDTKPEFTVIRSVAFGDYKAFSGRLGLASSLADPPLRSIVICLFCSVNSITTTAFSSINSTFGLNLVSAFCFADSTMATTFSPISSTSGLTLVSALCSANSTMAISSTFGLTLVSALYSANSTMATTFRPINSTSGLSLVSAFCSADSTMATAFSSISSAQGFTLVPAL
ncbi:carbonic anhydrase 14-like isoform X2 [Labeo rohita]|uniref:Carbonic anhydrase 14-like isoform X2 n=1 Tax=Labeo rohita TaxID=84645 RepID=A0A498LXX0_LABRO|nr:carbonic anhydrase 14-like isoform X2 [Labeo rohita]